MRDHWSSRARTVEGMVSNQALRPSWSAASTRFCGIGNEPEAITATCPSPRRNDNPTLTLPECRVLLETEAKPIYEVPDCLVVVTYQQREKADRRHGTIMPMGLTQLLVTLRRLMVIIGDEPSLESNCTGGVAGRRS